MNRLKTTDLGGMPFDLDDIRWQDDAVREAFYGLMSAFGIAANESFILSGCVITSLSYTEGFISLNGEICKVLAGTAIAPGAGEVVYWDFDVSYDSTGLETFENASSHDTYEIRRVIAKTGVPPTPYMPFDAERIGDKITNIIMMRDSNNYNVVSGDITYPGGGAGTLTLGIVRWKKMGKFYLLNITLNINITVAAGTIRLNLSSFIPSTLKTPTVVTGSSIPGNQCIFAVPVLGTPSINITPDQGGTLFATGGTFIWAQMWVELT